MNRSRRGTISVREPLQRPSQYGEHQVSKVQRFLPPATSAWSSAIWVVSPIWFAGSTIFSQQTSERGRSKRHFVGAKQMRLVRCSRAVSFEVHTEDSNATRIRRTDICLRGRVCPALLPRLSAQAAWRMVHTQQSAWRSRRVFYVGFTRHRCGTRNGSPTSLEPRDRMPAGRSANCAVRSQLTVVQD